MTSFLSIIELIAIFFYLILLPHFWYVLSESWKSCNDAMIFLLWLLSFIHSILWFGFPARALVWNCSVNLFIWQDSSPLNGLILVQKVFSSGVVVGVTDSPLGEEVSIVVIEDCDSQDDKPISPSSTNSYTTVILIKYNPPPQLQSSRTKDHSQTFPLIFLKLSLVICHLM